MTIAEAYSEESKEICFSEVNLNFVATQFPPRSDDSLKQQLAWIFYRNIKLTMTEAFSEDPSEFH